MLQMTVSEFHQWNDIAGHVVPIILAMFYGNWSDRRGRKLPLILGLTGKFIYSFMIVVNSMMDTWHLNMVVYTATLPMSILGGDVAIFGSCFAYISDVCSVQQRTLRITILDVIYLSTMPLGRDESLLLRKLEIMTDGIPSPLFRAIVDRRSFLDARRLIVSSLPFRRSGARLLRV
jgi:hypothetical protein